MLLKGGSGELGSSPEIRSKVRIGVLEGVEDSLDEVSKSTGVTSGGGVDIINSSHGEELLGNGSSD